MCRSEPELPCSCRWNPPAPEGLFDANEPHATEKDTD